ncbi:hypothetical protein A3Q56_04276 [Intoshia linei]|uniref:EF-hand domain-containing protein n=1 Tax=Intoshia linei TaxID=1819745 RepID=A0A177B142_9BILA|nr:hypothetical protein A3Q56_04276 [Intoshia linei]
MEEKLQEEAIQLFNLFDKDNTNSISIEELKSVIVFSLSSKCKMNKLDNLIETYKQEGVQVISKAEFLIILEKVIKQNKPYGELREIFDCLDTNNDGYITLLDLMKVINTLNDSSLPTNRYDIRFMIESAYQSEPGKISYDSF